MSRSISIVVAIAGVALWGCGESAPPDVALDGGRRALPDAEALPDGALPDGAATADGGRPGADAGRPADPPDGAVPGVRRTDCHRDAECDDGVSCTVDYCAPAGCFPVDETCAGRCQHELDPSTCGPTETCHELEGCVPGRACARASDCADDDPCTASVWCDSTRRVCMSRLLDGDGDGEPAPICGGADCDDADPRRAPGRTERCDGRDDDCDGTVDEAGTAACDLGQHCSEGRCRCDSPSLTECVSWWPDEPPACVDLAADPEHCGGCDVACGDSAVCAGGTCTCTESADTFCPVSGCVDLLSDRYNCGACRRSCRATETCRSGACSACGGAGQPCCIGDTCTAAHTVCSGGSTGTCELRSCAAPITPLPARLLPRCAASTLDCVYSCTTAACRQTCYATDATAPAEGVDCGLCVAHQDVACVNASGCEAAWASYACCVEDRCSGAPTGCTMCDTLRAAWNACADRSGCYIDTGIARACFAM